MIWGRTPIGVTTFDIYDTYSIEIQYIHTVYMFMMLVTFALIWSLRLSTKEK